jgi:hypothetical protein
MKTPKVVHCKKEEYDYYIGRPSKFGNPYSHIPYGTVAQYIVDTREEAIQRFEEWFLAQPELVKAAKKELKGKTLGCWCKPLDCHGDVLLRIANEEEHE